MALNYYPGYEGNCPLTQRSLWGAVSDLQMIGLALTSQQDPELARRFAELAETGCSS